MLTDPAVSAMLVAAIAVLLLVSATQKLRDVPSFHGVLDSYALLPAALLRPTAWTLPIVEASAGLSLLGERTRVLGAALGLTVLGAVTLAVAINLLRGRTDLGCGCGGIEDEQSLSWILVMRNLLLAGVLSLSLAHPTPRAFMWLDYLTIGLGAIALYGMYVSANQLLANQPRLWRLRIG